MTLAMIIRILSFGALLLWIFALVLDIIMHNDISKSNKTGVDLSKDYQTLYVISLTSRVLAVILALGAFFSN